MKELIEFYRGFKKEWMPSHRIGTTQIIPTWFDFMEWLDEKLK